MDVLVKHCPQCPSSTQLRPPLATLGCASSLGSVSAEPPFVACPDRSVWTLMNTPLTHWTSQQTCRHISRIPLCRSVEVTQCLSAASLLDPCRLADCSVLSGKCDGVNVLKSKQTKLKNSCKCYPFTKAKADDPSRHHEVSGSYVHDCQHPRCFPRKILLRFSTKP